MIDAITARRRDFAIRFYRMRAAFRYLNDDIFLREH